MKRLFLEAVFSDGEIVADPDGADYVDLAAATCDARIALQELVIEAIRSESPRIPVEMNIYDADRQALSRVFTADTIPALMTLHKS